MQPDKLTIHYYESFAQTHQGHGTDLAIVGGAMGYIAHSIVVLRVH